MGCRTCRLVYMKQTIYSLFYLLSKFRPPKKSRYRSRITKYISSRCSSTKCSRPRLAGLSRRDIVAPHIAAPCSSGYLNLLRRRNAGTGVKLLTIIVRYAPILVSTSSPDSLIRSGGVKPLLISLRLAVPA